MGNRQQESPAAIKPLYATTNDDDLNRPARVTPAAGQGAVFQYLKDAVNKRHISRMTVTGTGTWEWQGDGKGRTAAVLNPFNQLTAWKFDQDGKTLRETRSNGTWSDSSYNARDWLTQIEHRFADGGLIDRLQYLYTDSLGVYDPTGHLRREVDAQGQSHGFAYNELYEVIGESHPDFGTRTFSYDPNGNRRTKALTGGPTEWAGYDAGNRLLWTNEAADAPPVGGQASPYRTFGYDLNGQPTASVLKNASGLTNRTYAWDGMGKLRSLVATGALPENYSADYDGGGMRARATRNGVLSTYSFGLLEETVGVGNTVYTPGVSQRKAGVDRWFHSDWIGSSRYLTDSTGLSTPTAYRFEAYGGLSGSLGPDSTSSKFAGGPGYESDGPAGMLLLGHRYYDAALGRFLSPDPIGFAGGLNLYAYCEGDPVGLVDPSGLVAYMWNFDTGERIYVGRNGRGHTVIPRGRHIDQLPTSETEELIELMWQSWAAHHSLDGMGMRGGGVGAITPGMGRNRSTIAPARTNLAGTDMRLKRISERLPPITDFHDVVIHGSPNGFVINGNSIDHRAVARIMKGGGYRGGPIRLISCNTGGVSATAAQNLANKLGATVIAPSDTLWIHNRGPKRQPRMTIGPTPTQNTGRWRRFDPGKQP